MTKHNIPCKGIVIITWGKLVRSIEVDQGAIVEFVTPDDPAPGWVESRNANVSPFAYSLSADDRVRPAFISRFGALPPRSSSHHGPPDRISIDDPNGQLAISFSRELTP